MQTHRAPADTLFWGGDIRGLQVWYTQERGTIYAHLQDGAHHYRGGGTTRKKALKRLENVAPAQYHHTVNYMRVCYWLNYSNIGR